MKIERFEDVVAWQKARVLNQSLFKEFGSSKNFVFRDQLLRASLSITNNVAEGFERASGKELKHFLTIARGSAAEVRSMLYIAKDHNYISEVTQQQLLKEVEEVGRLLTGFIKSLSQSNYKTIKQSGLLD